MATALCNGVNTSELMEKIQALKQNPDLAQCTFRATNTWVDGGWNRSTIGGFHGAGQDWEHATRLEFDADEPPVLLGTDRGANPVEAVLHALAACLTTSFIYHAAAKGIRIDELESTLEGDLDLRGFMGIDPKIRNGYKNIRVRFRASADVDDNQLDELCRMAQARSPVFDIVTHGVPVEVSCERL